MDFTVLSPSNQFNPRPKLLRNHSLTFLSIPDILETINMCFWPIAHVELEHPPPPPKKEEKKDKPKPSYIMVSDQINLQPIVGVESLLNLFSPFLPHVLYATPFPIRGQDRCLRPF